MSPRVDGNRVRMRRAHLAYGSQGRAIQPERGQDAALGGHVETPPRRILRQHIRRVTNLVLADHAHRTKIDDLQRSVFFG